MTLIEFAELKDEFPGLEVEKAYHCHDEDEENEVVITLNNIIVGSELVSKDFVRRFINAHKTDIYL